MSDAKEGLERRGFLARMSVMAGAGAVLAVPARLRGMAAATSAAPRASDPDAAWIARVRGEQRVLVHAHRQLLQALMAADGLLRDGETYGIAASDHGIAVGVHGPAIGGIFDDAAWRRFRLGEFYEMKGADGQAATHNPYLRPQQGAPEAAALPPLMERGVVFVGCNVAVRNHARRIVAAGKGDGLAADAMHQALLASVVPGVTIVPNLFVSITRAQRHGLSYLFID